MLFVLNIAAITSLPTEQFTQIVVRVGAMNLTTCMIEIYRNPIIQSKSRISGCNFQTLLFNQLITEDRSEPFKKSLSFHILIN